MVVRTGNTNAPTDQPRPTFREPYCSVKSLFVLSRVMPRTVRGHQFGVHTVSHDCPHMLLLRLAGSVTRIAHHVRVRPAAVQTHITNARFIRLATGWGCPFNTGPVRPVAWSIPSASFRLSTNAVRPSKLPSGTQGFVWLKGSKVVRCSRGTKGQVNHKEHKRWQNNHHATTHQNQSARLQGVHAPGRQGK